MDCPTTHRVSTRQRLPFGAPGNVPLACLSGQSLRYALCLAAYLAGGDKKRKLGSEALASVVQSHRTELNAVAATFHDQSLARFLQVEAHLQTVLTRREVHRERELVFIHDNFAAVAY